MFNKDNDLEVGPFNKFRFENYFWSHKFPSYLVYFLPPMRPSTLFDLFSLQKYYTIKDKHKIKFILSIKYFTTNIRVY